MDVDSAIRGCNEAQVALVAALDGMTNDIARRPSLLPGWTVGHVLTHIARNADAHRRMAEGALRGELTDMYPGGYDARNAEIDDGAGRPATALIDDVSRSGDALAATWSRLPASAWEADGRRMGVQPWPNRDLPFLRWREVAVHALDLGLGIDVCTDAYVDAECLRLLTSLAGRLPVGVAVLIEPSDASWSTIVVRGGADASSPTVRFHGTRRALVGWLVGREPGPVPVGPLEGFV